jgi:hypothetical protein
MSNTKVKSFRLPIETIEWLDEESKKRNLTKTQLILQVINNDMVENAKLLEVFESIKKESDNKLENKESEKSYLEKLEEDSLFFMVLCIVILDEYAINYNMAYTVSNKNIEITIKIDEKLNQFRIKNSDDNKSIYIEVPKLLLGDFELDLFTLLSLWFLNTLTTRYENDAVLLAQKLLISDLKALNFIKNNLDGEGLNFKNLNLRFAGLIQKTTDKLRVSDTNVVRMCQIRDFNFNK